jgi:hypothetical protein
MRREFWADVATLITSVVVILCVLGAHAHAQRPGAQQQPPDYRTAIEQADQQCNALWADHAFDALRDKIPLGGQKPTLSMLTDPTRLVPSDKPLADLAIKAIEKCRALFAVATNMLPQQTQMVVQGFEREQDSLIAQLYIGKITIGEYNVAMNRTTVSLLRAMYGDAPPAASAAQPRDTSSEIAHAPSELPSRTGDSGSEYKNVAVPPQTKLALVIGNGNYSNLPKLGNPINDAREIAATLRSMGFGITLVADASELNIRREVRKFANESARADIALVFYAGHGAQINGQNYLLPVDMDIPRTEADIELSALKVDDLVNSVRSETKILFLDACRDNPALFKNLVKGRGAVASGLAPATASTLRPTKPGGGVFIAYATDAGSVALEGEGSHSPFTQALLRNLQKPLSIDDMFSLVTREVRLVTKNAQRPYKYASLENIICLSGACSNAFLSTAPASDIAADVRRSESEEFQIAVQTKNPNALEAFLEKYPDASQRDKAKAELSALRRSEFNEWTLYELASEKFPQYLKLGSIHPFGDKVAVSIKSLADPSVGLIEGKRFPAGTTVEDTAVYDCKALMITTSERTALNYDGKILDHFKWGNPEFLSMSIGNKITPGTVAATAASILCDEQARTPLVSKKRLAAMDFKHLASMPNREGEFYYQYISDQAKSDEQKENIAISKMNDEKNIRSLFPQVADAQGALGTFDKVVMGQTIKCKERKINIRKSEYYDANNILRYVVVTNRSAEIAWMDFNENTPLGQLQHLVCASPEAQK